MNILQRLLLHKSLLLSSLAGVLLMKGGCGLISRSGPTTSEFATPQIGYVARDLLYVMSQIVPPDSTTIQLGRPKTAFGKELEKGFRELGYGMQRVAADQGPDYMTYSETKRVTSKNQKTYAFTVYVGDVGLKREYVFVNPAGVAPISPLTVFGTAKAVSLNEQLFKARNDVSSTISTVEYSSSGEYEVTVPKITMVSDELIKDIVSGESGKLPNYTSLNSQNILIENLYTKGSSNFQLANKDYRMVRKDLIGFGDDSLRLLDRGKLQIEKMLRVYNSETDNFRLIGCSNGPTSYAGGNEGLALGRSRRVAEELITKGVKESSIYDEGCWAPVSAKDRFPARGVVIELRRAL